MKSVRSPWSVLLLGLASLLMVLALARSIPATQLSLPPSQYASTITAPFNQPNYYAIPTVAPPNYRTAGEWVGRLILPTVEQYQQSQETDWAWMQVYAAPTNARNLVGQIVRLAWSPDPRVQAYVKIASRNVRFTPGAEAAYQKGTITPIRLNGRNQVGPLQSLAGGHPYDDVTVVLRGKVGVEQSEVGSQNPNDKGQVPNNNVENQPPTLRVTLEPFQHTGQFVGLVKLVEPLQPVQPTPQQQCPGGGVCASDLMRVRHYNPATRQFNGAEEIVRIPQQPADWQGIYNMSTRDLEKSPGGEAGWYIYGAPDKTGQFTVAAMQPRSLVLVQPQQVVLGYKDGLKSINYGNWENLAHRKGTLQTVLLDSTATTPDAAKAAWKVGDRTLLIHNYGGRGGTQPHSETFIAGTYAGHFSFGVAEVIQDPFTGEPIFDINYFQVYGNGSDGTLSGPQTWANYMGNLRRGILGTRPVSDVLIRLDTLTDDYNFGNTKRSFFGELLAELSLIGDRYRIGDGSGDSTITSATSCVQDSAQALFMTLVRFRDKVQANPEIVQWMTDHPNDPNTQRFQRLVQLSKDMAEQLAPLGVVRWDWKENAEVLTGVVTDRRFVSIDNFEIKNLLTGLVSWRTAMPRQAYDEFSSLFLHNGAQLWFLRPNQIGGTDPGIAPLEPTLLLGAWTLPFTQIPLLSYLVIRTFGGATIATAENWLKTIGLLLGFATIAFPIGFAKGFFTWEAWPASWPKQSGTLVKLLFVPALVEEYIFRVLLLPYPNSWTPFLTWWGWAALALGIYVACYWLRSQWGQQPVRSTWAHPTFLILITLLGLTCTIAYRVTGSLWTITFLHWVAAIIWVFLLGGWKWLHLKSNDRRQIRGISQES